MLHVASGFMSVLFNGICLIVCVVDGRWASQMAGCGRVGGGFHSTI